jgi:hypothetical protein
MTGRRGIASGKLAVCYLGPPALRHLRLSCSLSPRGPAQQVQQSRQLQQHTQQQLLPSLCPGWAREQQQQLQRPR